MFRSIIFVSLLLLQQQVVTTVSAFGSIKPTAFTTNNNNNNYHSSNNNNNAATTTTSGRVPFLTQTTTTAKVSSSEKQHKQQQQRSSTSLSYQSSSALGMSSSSSTDSSPTTTTTTPLKIIIAGAPASGKGTQCEIIKSTYGVVHLSTGDILRQAVQDQTPVGRVAKEYMDSGKLVPDDVIIAIVKDKLLNDNHCQTRGWLLDGFPRTKEQAKALADAGVTADIFLLLHVPDHVLIERVVGRRTDPITGKIYHLTFSPPPTDIIDRLQHRSDDTVEKVQTRLQQYHANVQAIQDWYTDISISIDGNQSPSIVSQLITDAIEQVRVRINA